MEAPDRLTVLTCIGCGAMSELGGCLSTCTEVRLDLVPAEGFDRLAEELSRTRGASQAFCAIARRLAADDPTAADVERAYRALQAQARTALRAHPEGGDDWTRPAEPTTTWWCPECGGLDAPQPCIGVCIKRPAEWVNHDVYERERGQALRLLELERRLRPLVRRVAFVTPRAGQWERGWRVAQAEAVGGAEVLDGATPT